MRPWFWLVLAVSLVMAPVANGGERDGVTLPDEITIGEKSLVLNGMALRKKLFFKVYVAGLYLQEPATEASAALAADAPRHLVMHFVRDVGADKIAGAWREGVAKNVPGAEDDEALMADVERLCALMDDVKDGQVVTLTYRPGAGTTVAVDRTEVGTLGRKALADAWLACFIGPDPGPGKDFKRDLLGG